MAKEFGQELEGAEKDQFDMIVSELKNYRNFDVEALITILERIGNVEKFVEELNNPSLHYFLDTLACSCQDTLLYARGQADQGKKVAESLLENLKEFIRDVCARQVQEDKFLILDEFFGAILKKQGIDLKIKLETPGLKTAFLEVFTTNYDMIVENYCR
jgi:hypothetical protein